MGEIQIRKPWRRSGEEDVSMEEVGQAVRHRGRSWGIAVLLAAGFAMAGQAQAYPNALLSTSEIQAIGQKVKEGREPWKSAYQNMLSAADKALGSAGWNTRSTDHSIQYSQEEQEIYRLFGYSLTNVALARHLTGNTKYSDKAPVWIDRFFFNPTTYLKPDYRGDVVGSNGLTSVFYGVDLIMPFLDADRKTKLKKWMQDFTNDIGGGEFGGIGGNHNRADWSVATAMLSALAAEDFTKAKACFEHVKLRRIKSTGQIDGVGGNTGGQWDKEVAYNFFAMNAIMIIAEAARHNGLNLYSYDVQNGKPKLQRMLDFYAGWAYSQPKATGGNCAVYEIAYARYGDPKYLAIVNRVGRPINYYPGTENAGSAIFGPITLTYSRDSHTTGTTIARLSRDAGSCRARVFPSFQTEGLAARAVFADPRPPGFLHILDGWRLGLKASARAR